MDILLVACVSRKQPLPVPAKDLYVSPWFRKARAYAEATGDRWFVLSAKHGLVDPDEVISPYELTLNTLPAQDRCQWANGVLAQLAPHLDGIDCVVLLAGQRYREFLEAPLRNRGLNVFIPMEGLRIGEQLRWLNENPYG